MEEKEYSVGSDGIKIIRKRTEAETQVYKRKIAAHEFISHLPETAEPPDANPYIPQLLYGAIFCGHLVTDLDSIAGAVGAAELYGGIAARASEINTETAFALNLFNIPIPSPVEELLVSMPDAGICLVDHQQVSQLNKSIDVDRIIGVIDHHALQNATIVTDKPIYIDIRPWGSMSTIIAHTFMTFKRRPTKNTAGMLLCAILSDTLNLQGPTTTEWDRLMVTVLVEIADVDDIQFLASQQFKAKSSELAGLSSSALVNGDQKVFSFKTAVFDGSIGFAVVETTDDEIILSKKEELLIALAHDKEEKRLDLLFFAVVNIVSLHSTLLLCGPNEISLAEKSFPNGKINESPFVMDLGDLVSRKKDFIPAVTKAIKLGWTLVPKVAST
eukprot:CAMPEP_0119042480 /NCGR_PEP_ID=MMETSP1177-20130426/15385_1 /TAXON_ID=2985 /ORGANISM="Ochromonas sp, Strain CCMP1899" /LENGTH=385 /DNA_ID=CAMNT_0007009313 /DNA_START=222 /DNA_END=1382 /DNA_ORIENTATION=-